MVKFSVIGLDSTGFNENDQSRNSRPRIVSATNFFYLDNLGRLIGRIAVLPRAMGPTKNISIGNMIL